MNKKLLSLLLFVMAAFTAAFAQETVTVTVYDGTNTNGYVPVYGTWADAFNKCEFVMNAEQLGDLPAGSTITGLTWYLSTTPSGAWGGNFQIFIKEISATTISSFTGTDGATVVWEGPLDGTSGQVALEFNNYYTYEGGNLLIGVYQTQKGSFKSSAFYGVGTEGASVSGYSSSALESCTATQRNFVPKTTFTYLPSSGQVYYKPKNLQVSNITPNSAKLTWEAGGNETAWNVEYKKAADEEWTSAHVTAMTYDLDALANGTNYDVRVQADYGDGNLSGWLTGTFQTPICAESDMGEVSYVLTDSYGDRWSSNEYLQIVYNGTVVATINWPATSENKNEYIGSLNLCYGVDYDLMWVGNNSYTYECGFKLMAPDGSVIYEHVGGTSGNAPTPGKLTTFQINQVTCSRPTALAATNVVYNGATLSWTPGDEEQDAWEVVYGAAGFNPDEATPVAVSGEATYTITGLTENTAYTAYVRGNCGENDKSNWSDPVNFTTPLQFPLPTELAIDDITATTAKATWTGDAESYNLRYRTAAGKEMFYSNDFEEGNDGWLMLDEDGDADTWMLVDLSSSSSLSAHSGDIVFYSRSYNGSNLSPDNWLISPQVDLNGTLKYYVAGDGSWPETYRIYVSTTDTDINSFEPLTEDMQTPSTSMVYEEKTFDLSSYEGVKGYIAFRHYNCTGQDFMLIDDISIEGADIEAGEWTVLENVTSPVDLEGLTPSTKYEAQVQGIYADGTSQWTESTIFTTTDGLDVPTNLAISEITHNSAVATWEGTQDSYNLRYRTPAKADVNFFEGFENGLDAWTLVNTDGDNYNWQVIDPETAFTNGSLPRFEGTYCVMSRSYASTALTPDQWMISPEIEDLGGMLRYYVMDDGANYQETYRIYVSTGSTDIADFVPVTEDILTPNSAAWTEQAVDLSAYAGQSGRIAFRHYNCTDQDFMFIDAIGIYANEIPAGEWTVLEGVTSPADIEGLDPETEYEVQVQGILGENTTNWTESVLFTTLEAPVLEPVITVDVAFGTYNEAQTVHVTVENMPEGGVIKYQLVPSNAKEEWSDYDDATGIVVDQSAALTVAVMDADGEILAALEGEYVIDAQTGIATIGVDGYDNNAWYNLNGQKLNGKPTVPGIYINGNKKVVIK